MALKRLSSFNQVSYISNVQPFVDFAVRYVESTAIKGRTGWRNHFYSYAWSGDWQAGLDARYRLRQQLDICSSDQQFLTAVNGIMGWGGLKLFALDKVPLLRRSLIALDLLDRGSEVRWQAIWAERIASVTKVYAFHDPEKWTIYDARVANGLATLVSAYWGVKGYEHLSEVLRFPQPPARIRRVLPPGFPRGSSQDQFRLAFVYSSWLLRAIADSLNAATSIGQPPSDSPESESAFPSTWKVCHVEMVLFMLGQ